jgi:hypothetical protein
VPVATAVRSPPRVDTTHLQPRPRSSTLPLPPTKPCRRYSGSAVHRPSVIHGSSPNYKYTFLSPCDFYIEILMYGRDKIVLDSILSMCLYELIDFSVCFNSCS